jgi:hypothetical protein
MPSTEVAAGTPAIRANEHTPAGTQVSPAFQLAQADRAAGSQCQQALRLAAASRALWAATLSLMAAFMQTQAPAHRYLLARRISRNFDTLSRQDCFDTGCRSSFTRLAARWQARAEQLSPIPKPVRAGLFDLFS